MAHSPLLPHRSESSELRLKATYDAATNQWIVVPHILTRGPKGLSDRPVSVQSEEAA